MQYFSLKNHDPATMMWKNLRKDRTLVRKSRAAHYTSQTLARKNAGPITGERHKNLLKLQREFAI